MRLASRAASLALALATPSCTLIDAPGPPGMGAPRRGSAGSAGASSASQPDVDASAVLDRLRGGAFRDTPAFTHVTRTPYASSAAQGAWVDEWVSSESYAEYASVRPDATGSGARMPVGTVIVRVVLDADGGTTELTVMAKGPSGTNPDLGDWWFAVTDPGGTPEEDDAGAMMGRLDGCYGCHAPRSGDDYLFGAPADDRP